MGIWKNEGDGRWIEYDYFFVDTMEVMNRPLSIKPKNNNTTLVAIDAGKEREIRLLPIPKPHHG